MNMNSVKDFLSKMLGDTGAVSFARCISLLIVVVVLAWDSSYVYTAHYFNTHLPPGATPFPMLPDAATLLGQVAFMTCFYATNKVTDGWKGSNRDERPPQ